MNPDRFAMDNAAPVTPRVSAGIATPRLRWNLLLFLLALAGYWVLAFNALRVDWSVNPQYYYGWFVPFLVLGLFRFRWMNRPEPLPPVQIALSATIAVVALASLLPIRLIEEANPEWRLIQWTHVLQMVVVTLCCLYYAGGRAWARHFAFVVCFLFLAAPWPVPLENFVVQNLMRVVAAITVELVGLVNIPAVQQGNLIQISSGLVGVNEACSGVRSLQTAFFVTLFLGELYRFSWTRRFLLVFLGFLVALLCNIGRTFFLVSSAARHGLERMNSFHDTAGGLVLGATLISIAVLAQLLKRCPAGPLPPPSHMNKTPRLLPIGFILGVFAWFLAAEVCTQLWYRFHEAHSVENAHWTAVWPEIPEKVQTLPVDPTVIAMLRCSEGKSGVWQDGTGNHWMAYFFRWPPGRNSAQLATAHTPDICFRGAGYQLTSDLGIRKISLQGMELPFHEYVFSNERVQLHVFYCRWEDKRSTESHASTLREDGSKLSRLEAVLAGRRHRGQQVLEITVNGPANPEEAFAALEQQIPRMIRQ